MLAKAETLPASMRPPSPASIRSIPASRIRSASSVGKPKSRRCRRFGAAGHARLFPHGRSPRPRTAAADSDTTTAPPVVLINEAAARRFSTARIPREANHFWGALNRTIVGVVGNERFQGLAEAPPIAVYSPLEQAPSTNGAGVLLVRDGRQSGGCGTAVRRRHSRTGSALRRFLASSRSPKRCRTRGGAAIHDAGPRPARGGRARPCRDRRTRRAELQGDATPREIGFGSRSARNRRACAGWW